MSLGKQIEEYERPYRVVFGEDGGEQTAIPGPEGPDFPLWRARRWIVAVIQAQVEKLPEGDERTALDKIRREFHIAPIGDLAFGLVRRWVNGKGQRRFIGITPASVDYRDAGNAPSAPAPLRDFPSVDPHLPKRKPKPRPKRMSEAERIADRMAKAARKAVEGK